MKNVAQQSAMPWLLPVVLVTLLLGEHYGGRSWLSSDGWCSVVTAVLGLAYFVVLMVVECSRPGRWGRHRRDQPEGAW